MKEEIILENVQEYCEEFEVNIITTDGIHQSLTPKEKWVGHGRLVIRAINEGGYNSTEVDLLQLIDWLKKNKPELLK